MIEDYEDEMDDSEDYCQACNGTGIATVGRVDDSCSHCGGSGVISSGNNDCDDFPEPDEKEYPDTWTPDNWEP